MPSHLASIASALSVFGLLAAACDPPDSGRLCELGAECPGASAERCRDGEEARLYGRGGFDGRTCVASDDATCRRSSVSCRLFGQCRAPEAKDGAEGPALCRRSGADADYVGAEDGRCAGNGSCVADEASCAASGYCELAGRCRAEDGICVAKDAITCQGSRYCAELGWCDRVSSPLGPRCRPTSDLHCRDSRTCDNLGNCALDGQSCQACARSNGCRDEGRCALDGRRCIATSNAHCQRSRACKVEGRCSAALGSCTRG